MEHWGVVPDIMTIAKGITSSYLPLAAAVTTREVADAFAGGDNIFRQALTFGGHPVTSAVALKNIEIIERENLVDNSAKVGAYFLDRLHELKQDHLIIGDVRGKGLLLGIELVRDRETKEKFANELKLGQRMTQKFRGQGLLLSPANSAIGIGPPLSITKDDVDTIVAAIDRIVGEIETELAISPS